MASFNGWQHVPARPGPAAGEDRLLRALSSFSQPKPHCARKRPIRGRDHAGGRGPRPGGGPKRTAVRRTGGKVAGRGSERGRPEKRGCLHNQCHQMPSTPEQKADKKEIELCLPYLEDQMDAIRPRIICLMGNTAIQAVLGVVGVTVLRGRILSDRFLVTYHPAAVLRNRNLMADFVSDLREAKIQSLKLSKDAFAE